MTHISILLMSGRKNDFFKIFTVNLGRGGKLPHGLFYGMGKHHC